MLLYHVSNRLYTQPHLFIPRIPDRTMEHEDMRHPRICFSDSLAGCLTGMPSAPAKGGTVSVFELNVSEQDANFVPYTALMKRDAVSDAYYSHECWYTKPVTLTPYDICITDLHYRNFFVLRNHQKEEILREFMAMPQSDFVEDMGAFMEAFEKEDINYFFDVGIYDLLGRETAEKLDLKKWLGNYTYKARAYTDVQYRIMAKCAA